MRPYQIAREDDSQTLAPAEATGQPKAQSFAKNRGRLDVMADLLHCCRSPASKSHIMLLANVNSIVANRMIDSLSETGLLDSVHEDGNVVYLATPKGVEFLGKYVELQRLISRGMVPAESKMNNPDRFDGRLW